MFSLFIYLSNQVRIEVQGLHKDALHAVMGQQLDLGQVWLFLHEVKKRLHFPPGEGQHRVQIIHHPVWWRRIGERNTSKEEEGAGMFGERRIMEVTGSRKRANCDKLVSNSSPKNKQSQCVCLASQILQKTLETVYAVRQELLGRRTVVSTQSWLFLEGGRSVWLMFTQKSLDRAFQ